MPLIPPASSRHAASTCCLLALVFAAACDASRDTTRDAASARADTPAARATRVARGAGVPDGDCVRDSLPRHDDPVALVEEWVRREAEGPMEREDAHAAWVEGALTCEARVDSLPYTVVADVRVRPAKLTNYGAAVLVERTRLFAVVRDTARGGERLVPETGRTVDTVQAIRTRHGWRIARLPEGAHRLPARAAAERTALPAAAKAVLREMGQH